MLLQKDFLNLHLIISLHKLLIVTLSCNVIFMLHLRIKIISIDSPNTQNRSAIQLHLSIMILNVFKTITNCFSQLKKSAKDSSDCPLASQSSYKPQVPLLSHSFLFMLFVRIFLSLSFIWPPRR